MANVEYTAASGSVKNIFTDDVDLVLIGPVVRATDKDTVTLTDVKKIYWAMPCILGCAGTGDDVYAGTAFCDYSVGSGTIAMHGAAGSAGTGYILAVIARERL